MGTPLFHSKCLFHSRSHCKTTHCFLLLIGSLIIWLSMWSPVHAKCSKRDRKLAVDAGISPEVIKVACDDLLQAGLVYRKKPAPEIEALEKSAVVSPAEAVSSKSSETGEIEEGVEEELFVENDGAVEYLEVAEKALKCTKLQIARMIVRDIPDETIDEICRTPTLPGPVPEIRQDNQLPVIVEETTIEEGAGNPCEEIPEGEKQLAEICTGKNEQ